MPRQEYHGSHALEKHPVRHGVLVLAGYGVRVGVERRHLVCEDGWCAQRRRIRLHRATCGIRRLCILARGGVITLEALRVLEDLGAGLVCADIDGTVLLAQGPRGLDDARLRRAQALAPTNGVGLEITRELLQAKLVSQAAVLDRMPDADAARAVRDILPRIEEATSLEELRLWESRAGLRYWEAWWRLPVRWDRASERRVPEHWKTAGPRISPITGSPRLAATPVHAMLNLLYALLEAEAAIACLAVGLDPGLGILHADQPARASLSLDVMEPVRPAVDAFVLDLLHSRILSARDFQEVARGQVRVLLPLARALLETCPRWALEVAPWAECVSQRLAQAAGLRRRLPTPLTEANRSAGREGIRRQAPKRPPRPELGYAVCARCGVVLESSGRKVCPACTEPDRTERIVQAGMRVFRARKDTGVDPSHGGKAARRRGETMRQRMREIRAWEAQHPRPEPDVFRREILPRLRSVPIERIAREVGLSLRYASLIRRGAYVPHPRWWEALRKLAQAAGAAALAAFTPSQEAPR
jgi:CRISPR-associated endonuclease Cas1